MTQTENKIYDSIIIGTGPAALTAGMYLGRSRNFPLIIEGPIPGGQLTTTYKVENYPGVDQIEGPELVAQMRLQAAKFGCEFESSTIDRVEFENSNIKLFSFDKMYQSKSVIIATGSSHKELGISGEREFHNSGVFTCFTCDGAFYQDEKVVIIGGGDTAFEACLYLSKICSEIVLVHRSEQFRGSKILLERIQKLDNVTIITNTKVLSIEGKDCVQSVKVESEKYIYNIECSGVCICIGHNPNTKIFEKWLELDNNGYIKKDQIKINGVFVCGDCCDPIYQQAAVAVGSGCMAAIDCTKYLTSL